MFFANYFYCVGIRVSDAVRMSGMKNVTHRGWVFNFSFVFLMQILEVSCSEGIF